MSRKTKNTVIGATLLALVTLLEFDGRRWYHWKEHRLVLLLIPRFCLYDRCEWKYVHSPGAFTVTLIYCCHAKE